MYDDEAPRPAAYHSVCYLLSTNARYKLLWNVDNLGSIKKLPRLSNKPANDSAHNIKTLGYVRCVHVYMYTRMNWMSGACMCACEPFHLELSHLLYLWARFLSPFCPLRWQEEFSALRLWLHWPGMYIFITLTMNIEVENLISPTLNNAELHMNHDWPSIYSSFINSKLFLRSRVHIFYDQLRAINCYKIVSDWNVPPRQRIVRKYEVLILEEWYSTMGLDILPAPAPSRRHYCFLLFKLTIVFMFIGDVNALLLSPKIWYLHFKLLVR